jgi:hypothetical protein
VEPRRSVCHVGMRMVHWGSSLVLLISCRRLLRLLSLRICPPHVARALSVAAFTALRACMCVTLEQPPTILASRTTDECPCRHRSRYAYPI